MITSYSFFASFSSIPYSGKEISVGRDLCVLALVSIYSGSLSIMETTSGSQEAIGGRIESLLEPGLGHSRSNGDGKGKDRSRTEAEGSLRTKCADFMLLCQGRKGLQSHGDFFV